jgi:hypothetical protein
VSKLMLNALFLLMEILPFLVSKSIEGFAR